MPKINTLQNQIEIYSNYFRSIEIIEDALIISVKYPDKWDVYDSEDGQIRAVKSEDFPNVWLYWANKNQVTIEDIFKLIDNTITTNKNAIAKVDLLSEKFNQLKELFASEPLDKLKTLEFTFSKKKKKKNNELINTPQDDNVN